MKVVLRILGIIAACIGIYFSTTLLDASNKIEIPKKYVYVSDSSYAYDMDWSRNTGAKYLGGDAYNYIVEASLKAGYYNATVVTKTVKEIGGIVLLFSSIFFLFFSLYSLQSSLSSAAQVQNPSNKDYQDFVLQHLQRIEENTNSRIEYSNTEYSDGREAFEDTPVEETQG